MTENPPFVEVSSVRISDDHANRLADLTNNLNDSKVRLAELALRMDHLEAEYRSRKRENEAKFGELKAHIDRAGKLLTEFTNELVASHNISLSDGGWSLSVAEKRFVRLVPAAQAAQSKTTKKSPKKGTRK